jgi:hypothetical protein
MTKKVFEDIGYDYYKGLKNKLPPIRYMGKDELDNDTVCLAHPKDFLSKIKEFKQAYDDITNDPNIDMNNMPTIENNRSEILEIYPSTQDLLNVPNGFIALFVNDAGINILESEFNSNDEVNCLKFLEVNENGIDTSDVRLCGVIDTFIKKFNKRENLVAKYNGMYLVVGEMKDMNITSGQTKNSNKFNIIGGKRAFDEDTIQSTIRETTEELGLSDSSIIYNLIKILLPKTKDIIKCASFNVYCLFFTPKDEHAYDNFIHTHSVSDAKTNSHNDANNVETNIVESIKSINLANSTESDNYITRPLNKYQHKQFNYPNYHDHRPKNDSTNTKKYYNQQPRLKNESAI